MGHEIPAGLGVRLHEAAGPEVLVVVGDGTFVMAPTELITAAQEGLKITVVVLDNGGYQSINGLAVGATGTGAGNEFRHRGADGRLPDGERMPIDIAGMATAMGVRGVLVDSAAALGAALSDARQRPESSVIVVPTASDRPLLSGGAFWDLGVPEVSADADTRALAADFLRRRGAQRSY